ncbi:hypothetical protein ACMZ6Z_09250 [Streptococcus pluranimalium]|uniref:hypothetical protein n=1 Tax=Streptococcus pluranimalium TaxID=82348 RepID=UPI0039FC5E06
MGIVDTDILNELPAKEYVFPVEYLDTIVQSSGGDITYLERNLGLEIGSLGENPVIMKVKQGNYSDLSIPSGNEFGANDQWIPGGKLPTGIPEAVIDPVSIEKVEIKEWSNYVKEQLKPY